MASNTKQKAIYQFFSSFGISAYAENSVPDNAQLPYLTYKLAIDSYGKEINISVNLFYYTSSENIPDAKAAEISEAIGLGGRMLPCDGGGIWIKRGTPWCQALRDDSDPKIKRRYINVTAEYITLN